MIRRVTIEKLAPTGEGVSRTAEGVGFVAGALPGEEVDAEVVSEKKRFWFGRAVSVLKPSALRASGPHAACAGCDWAHIDKDSALDLKPRLFLETMERIGKLDPRLFGELPIVPSEPAYRIRSRFHVAGRGAAAAVGFHSPVSHRVEPAQGCLALTDPMRAALPGIAEAIAQSGAAVSEIATLETLDASRRLASVTLAETPVGLAAGALAASLSKFFEGVRIRAGNGEGAGSVGLFRLPFRVGGRAFEVSADSFFQVNRHLVERVYEDVRAAAKAVAPGRALDAYGGVGLFAGALLDAGHRVLSVEGHAVAAESAVIARRAWGAQNEWETMTCPVESFLGRDGESFDVVVADPPRAGLGLGPARELARRARGRLIYVSCDPATLARDLSVLLEEGLTVSSARLYDLFAFTHRVEAMVVLDRRSAP